MNKRDDFNCQPEQTYHAIRGSRSDCPALPGSESGRSAMVTAYWEIGEQIYKACGK